MAKPFKIVSNSDAGTADLVGGNDWDNAMTFLNNQSDFHTYSYYLYKDGTTYKAKNGATGEVSFSHASDAGNVLASIFNSVSTTTPLYIEVGAGDFTIKSWGETNFRHSNFTIQGQGSGLTNFVIHNDVFDIAGQSRVFSFEANPTAYTSISLASNTSVDDWRVLTNAETDLVAGCHVVIGDDTLAAGSAKQGEHNRIVKIVETGGSPSKRLILEKDTKYAYTTGANAFIRRVDFLENIHFEGFTIKSNQDFDTVISFMRWDFVYDGHMKDVQFKDWGVWNGGGFHNCLVHNSVINSQCDDLTFEQSPERGHSTGENAVGYAISTRAGCETVYYQNCRFKGPIRHCFTTTANTETAKNGQPRNIWLINCNAETTDEASFDTHEEGNGINFINCSVHSTRAPTGTDSAAGTDDADAFNIRSSNTRCINCSVQNCKGKAFSCDGTTTGNVFDGCYVDGITFGMAGITPTGSNHVVRNCHIKNVDKQGIIIGNSSTNIQVSNCTIKNVCRTDTSLAALDIGTSCVNVSVDHVNIDKSADDAVIPIKTGTGCDKITFSSIHILPTTGTQPSLSGTSIKWDFKNSIGYTGIISPSQLTGDQNNYTPTNFLTSNTLRLDGDGSNRTITGFGDTTQIDGFTIKVRNIGSNTIMLADEGTLEAASSTAGNRIALNGYNYPLFPRSEIDLTYDGTLTRWISNKELPIIPSRHWGYYAENDVGNIVADGKFTITAASGGSVTSNVDAGANHPGVLQFTLGTSTTGNGTYRISGTALTVGNSWYWRFDMICKILSLSTATDRYTLRCGFIDSGTVESTDAVMFRYTDNVNSGKWERVTRSNGTETATDTTVTVGTTNFTRLTILINPAGTNCQYFIDGTSVGSNTTNIPTGAGRNTGAGFMFLKSAGTTDTAFYQMDNVEIVGYAPTRRTL